MYKRSVKWGSTIGSGRYVQVGDKRLPQTYEMHWTPDGDENRPALRMLFQIVDGVPQCRGVHVDATEHGREVRRTDLDFPIEAHLELATQVVAQLGHTRTTEFVLDRTSDPFLRTIRQARRTSLRRGPSDEQLREAADVYRSTEHAPTQAVADHFDIAHRTASGWIGLARKKGFL
jgi:hypothetical protein